MKRQSTKHLTIEDEQRDEDSEDMMDVFTFEEMPYPDKQMSIYGFVHKEADGKDRSRR